MSKADIIQQLDTFLSLSDRKLFDKLARLPLDNPEQARVFVTEVSAALDKNARNIWNDWQYFNPIGIPMIIGGFAIAAGRKFFPSFAYTNSGVALAWTFVVFSTIPYLYHLRQLTWRGSLAVDELLLAITVDDKFSAWQHARLQKEIIVRLATAKVHSQKNLDDLMISPKDKRSFNTKKVAGFITEVESLLPEFIEEAHHSTAWQCAIINGLTMSLTIFGFYGIYQLMKGGAPIIEIIIGLIFTYFTIRGQSHALTLKYGGSYLAQWDIHRVKTILQILKEDYRIRQTLEDKLLLPKPAAKKLDTKNDDKYKPKSKPSTRRFNCCGDLTQVAALMSNMVKAVAWFGFAIISKPFRPAPQVDKYTEAEINAEPEKEEKSPPPAQKLKRPTGSAKKPGKSAKTPPHKLAPASEANHSDAPPGAIVIASPIAAVAQDSERVAQEPVTAPVKLPPPASAPTADPISQAPVKPPAAQMPVITAPIELPPPVNSRTSQSPISLMPTPAEEKTEPHIVMFTSPSIFGGQAFPVTVPADRVRPGGSLLELTDEERLKILAQAHKIVCDSASGHFARAESLTMELRRKDKKIAVLQKRLSLMQGARTLPAQRNAVIPQM